MIAVIQEQFIGNQAVRPGSMVGGRRVSFQSHVSVAEASPLPLRRKTCWYQPEDFVSFNKEIIDTVRALWSTQGDLSCLDPAKYCLRGLEHKIFPKFGRQQRFKQMAIIRAVLCSQEDQRETGTKDPETIKSLYMMFSKLSRDRAVELAELDAKACQHSLNFQSPTKRRRLSAYCDSAAPLRPICDPIDR